MWIWIMERDETTMIYFYHKCHETNAGSWHNDMETSWNVNAFSITDPLLWESIGLQRILTRSQLWWGLCMMTSSNGSIFRVTGPLCGEFTGPGEFPTQRPVTRSFDVFFDLRLNKRLSKQSWGWWCKALSRPLWRHRNGFFPVSNNKL